MKYLVDVTETYRVDTEQEVNQLIDEAKKDGRFELSKYSRVQRDKKQKGEIIESWFKVTLNKRFTDEKEPDGAYTISYKSGLEEE